MNPTTTQNHKLLASWAADCAEHVLEIFENVNPNDDRPRKAIEAARAWVRDELTVGEVRKVALAAHAAAREAENPEVQAAARSAGHAAATAYVASHAQYAASYALKATENAGGEKEWQLKHLPSDLPWILGTKEEKD